MATGLQHDAILADEKIVSANASGVSGLLERFNDAVFKLSALALVVAAVVLTVGVVASHVLGRALDWQDEVTIFLIAGAVFMSAASVQAKRGHVGIEVLGDYMTPSGNRARGLVTDAIALAFVAIFAVKAGTLLYEAWAEGQKTHSAWGPPLWIPYSLLTAGMTLLALQMAAQVGERSLVTLGLVVAAVAAMLLWSRPPTPLITGVPQQVISIAFCVITRIAMFSGMPIAFALGSVALAFMMLFMRRAAVDTIAQNVYEELANVIILAIPLFILKGAAIGRSNAGRDLYSAQMRSACRRRRTTA